jgi:2-dehydro-3-deoxygluconokinase
MREMAGKSRNTPRRFACIGEAMIELSDLDSPDGRAALGVAGDVFNTAVYLARAVSPDIARVDFVTAVGTDGLSARMLDAMTAEGLGTDLVARLDGRLPGLYAIALDAAGERRFHYWRGQSAARAMFGDDGVPVEALRDFDVVYLSGITLAILPPDARERLIAACGAVARSGGQVIFDSNYRPHLWPDADTARAAMAAMWQVTALGLPSRDDEAALWGKADPETILDRLSEWGVVEIALKNGADGPVLRGGPGAPVRPGHYPAAPVVVDTTAAGDSFNAGYIAARLGGADPVAAAEAGHALAVRVIGRKGAIIPRD